MADEIKEGDVVYVGGVDGRVVTAGKFPNAEVTLYPSVASGLGSGVTINPLPLINLHAECERRIAAANQRAESIATQARAFLAAVDRYELNVAEEGSTIEPPSRKALMDVLER